CGTGNTGKALIKRPSRPASRLHVKRISRQACKRISFVGCRIGCPDCEYVARRRFPRHRAATCPTFLLRSEICELRQFSGFALTGTTAPRPDSAKSRESCVNN